ncbi:hypothetical protein BDA96_10G148400 [Sorghum bicolor]|uniref:GRF-type domain-containing protein n=2 Tax=Sorghum bicolor TaxID=4558 RepID=C5Z8Y7_SORBI|nr:hypothetical protein SORBI_3010G120500 [Sorghum bicolor]KAG0513964.1 hypothetical protein BDA96_10G148400 [Sorghum bicolor]
MAESSRLSSQGSGSSGLGGGTNVEVRGSPVLYRIGPFDYLPPVFCKCNMKGPRWISWSVDNPGRRYYRCKMANTAQDCHFFEWLDPPTTAWIKELLLDLKSVVDKLKSERGQPVVDEGREQHYQELEQLNHSLQRQLMNMEAHLEAKEMDLLDKDEELLQKDEQLVQKDQGLQGKLKELEELQLKMKRRTKGFSSVCGSICVFVVGMLFAMLFNGRAN